MTAKKLAILMVLAATVVAVALIPSVALANMGPHGGYLSDTDACAECHRAHTAPSSVTWTDNQGGSKSALLLSNAATVSDFCLVCHDDKGQGADTNVLDGMYEGTQYGTTSAKLLGGPFGRVDKSKDPAKLYAGYNASEVAVTSTHLINGQSWGAYGGGVFGSTSSADASGNAVGLQGTGAKIVMDCGSCHDPHGSSNYRILKDVVYGVSVGGYTGTGTDPTPTPFVLSKEQGFPVGGFRLHTQYSAYIPNYTVAQYSVPPVTGSAPDPLKGMSGWCAGCHTTYMTKTSTYDAGDGFGNVDRHRHPVNVPMSNYQGPSAVVVTDSVLPFAHLASDPSGVTAGKANAANTSSDWIECLTCHNAHGASTVMTGFANVDSSVDPLADTGEGGTAPTNDSALLKLNNRGVCETCHNK
jgi:cytochrome c553